MGNICDSRECGGSGPSRHVQSLYDHWNDLPHNRAARQALNAQLAEGQAPAPAALHAGGSTLVEREQALVALDALYRMQFEERVGKHGVPTITQLNGVVRLDKYHYHFEINCNHPEVGAVAGMRWCVHKSEVGFWDFLAPPPTACTRGHDSMLGTTAHVPALGIPAAAVVAPAATNGAATGNGHTSAEAVGGSNAQAKAALPPASPLLGVVISDSTAVPPSALASAEATAAAEAAARAKAAAEEAKASAAAAAAAVHAHVNAANGSATPATAAGAVGPVAPAAGAPAAGAPAASG